MNILQPSVTNTKLDLRDHVCMKCGVEGTLIYPHYNITNGKICGYLFLCQNCAPIYANGRLTLEARQ